MDYAVANEDCAWIFSFMELRPLGWNMEEIQVSWAHLEKKRTRLELYTKVDEENAHSVWRRRQEFRDDVRS
ncbi:hypothetical protein Tco_0773881 [Tanacetum coccineum]|uniref:Uncharacterized protein n=1 Tax=Tanacetum coccineum TaxID=301880 RepID=A0ABQ4ZM13_9ASTR